MTSRPGSRVQVAVRLRPVLKPNDEEKEPSVRGISDKALEIWNWRDSEQSLRFDFDAYFDGAATQKTVFERSVKPLLANAVSGQNASVFAYGPTGTGKTFTMLGTDEHPGVIPRSLNHIFQVIDLERQKKSESAIDSWTHSVSFSYLEIYQEKIYDLLEPKNRDLPIRQDRQHNIFIPGLAEKTVTSFSEFAKHFIPASKNRTTAATKLNSRSSRSHSILLLKIVKERKEGTQLHRQTGKLYLIDLAGSENNKKTGNQGIRLKESGAINTSLFVLGLVVDALNQRLPRIPYRDSKLTRLLQDSLGGSAHACMITNIAPEERHYMDTYTTLHFAAKSKQIVNKPFTRETTQSIVRAPSRKRALDTGEKGVVPSSKSQAMEVDGKPTAVSLSNESMSMIRPLLERQENFEASVQQRLQSLEQNLLRQFENTKQPIRTPTSKKLLSEVQDMRRELAGMKKTDVKLPSPPTTLISQDRRSTFTLDDPHRPSPPQAVVRPLSVFNQEPSKEGGRAEKPPVKPKQSKSSKKSSGVKFVKAVHSTESMAVSASDPDSKENQWQLRLDPDFQEKHRNEILKTLNKGTIKQLKSLQSVGEKRAQLIYNWRNAFGAFSKVEDLYKVSGLPSKTVDNILGNNLLCSSTVSG